MQGGLPMAEQRTEGQTREATDAALQTERTTRPSASSTTRTEERVERREAPSVPAHLMGRQAARAADAAARADGDPNRIEAGALSPTPERLSIGADREERM